MKQVGEYIITQSNIAHGAFASIHKGKHKYSNTIVAIKEIKVKSLDNIKNYIKREIEIHRSLDHPNIVKVFDVIYHQSENAIFIVMEFCEYGDLQKFQNKKSFNEKYIQYYMLQLRDALKYLRDKNIVHRDLKPQNILLISPVHIKITDFGLSRNINLEDENNSQVEDLFSTYCGSPIYMSPELLNHERYNSKSDLWSLGIILYELITGYPPFLAKNLKQLVAKINTEKIDLSRIDRKLISDNCFQLLTGLLDNNKSQRINWNEFFQHKWFNNILLIDDDNLLIEQPLNNILITNTPIFNQSCIPSSNSAGNLIGTTTTTSNNIILDNANINANDKSTDNLYNSANDTTNSRERTNRRLKFSDNLNINKLLKSLDLQQEQIKRQSNTNPLEPDTNPLEPDTNPLEPDTNLVTSDDVSNDISRKETKLSPLSQRRSNSISKRFTHSLKSSNFIEDSPKSQVSDINLSDLVQDDLPNSKNSASQPININNKNSYSYSTSTRLTNDSSSDSSSLTNNTPTPKYGTSLPNIYSQSLPHRIQSHHKSPPSIIKHNISPSIQNTTTATTHETTPATTHATSPSSIMNALRFIKETYDYLSSDNKSL